MTIKMNDHDLTEEKRSELEKLSASLNVDKELCAETVSELEEVQVSLEEKIEDLESQIEELKDERDNEKYRGDILFDEKTQLEDRLELVEDRCNEVISWLENREKNVAIEDIIKQLN